MLPVPPNLFLLKRDTLMLDTFLHRLRYIVSISTIPFETTGKVFNCRLPALFDHHDLYALRGLRSSLNP